MNVEEMRTEPPLPKGRPMRTLPNQKVAVLIDDNNITCAGDKKLRHKIDYAKLLKLIGEREILRAMLYRPVTRDRHFPVEFRDALERKLGIEVKTPPKNVDCWLTVDAISLAGKADVIVLIAGDKDYVPLVHYLKAQGCKVEVLSWPRAVAEDLVAAADQYSALDCSILQAEEPKKIAA